MTNLAGNKTYSVFNSLAEELTQFQAAGLYRKPRSFTGPSSRVVAKEGRELVCLASNNYLGLSTHPSVIDAAMAAARSFGTGSGASRLVSSGTLELHVRLEATIARFKETEDAVLFSSGYMANVGTISALVGPGDMVFTDKLNHASVIDGCRLSGARMRVYHHADAIDLQQLLQSSSSSRRLIVTDGVFSMDGDLAPLPEILELAKLFDAWILVDDAHATGVLGHYGRGTLEYYNLRHPRLIQLGTLSKAVGVEGGFVAGPRILIEYLRNKARTFIYSTAPAPPVTAAAIKSLEILQNEPKWREQLRNNSVKLREGLRALGYTFLNGPTPIIPVMIGDPAQVVTLSRALETHGVLVPAIRPPTVPKGTSRLRATVMATHTPGDLEQVLAAFEVVRGLAG